MPDSEKSEAIASMVDQLHDRSRLAIISLLATSQGGLLPFTRLQEKTAMTAGNLSSHLRMLENRKMVTLHKEFVGRRPRTTVYLSFEGRKALEMFIASMEELIRVHRGR